MIFVRNFSFFTHRQRLNYFEEKEFEVGFEYLRAFQVAPLSCSTTFEMKNLSFLLGVANRPANFTE